MYKNRFSEEKSVVVHRDWFFFFCHLNCVYLGGFKSGRTNSRAACKRYCQFAVESNEESSIFDFRVYRIIRHVPSSAYDAYRRRFPYAGDFCSSIHLDYCNRQ